MEIGKYYGSAADRTLRVVYNPSEIHPGMHFSSESVSYVVDFFSACFDLSPSIPSTNQVWFLKELFNLLGVIGIFLSILSDYPAVIADSCFFFPEICK